MAGQPEGRLPGRAGIRVFCHPGGGGIHHHRGGQSDAGTVYICRISDFVGISGRTAGDGLCRSRIHGAGRGDADRGIRDRVFICSGISGGDLPADHGTLQSGQTDQIHSAMRYDGICGFPGYHHLHVSDQERHRRRADHVCPGGSGDRDRVSVPENHKGGAVHADRHHRGDGGKRAAGTDDNVYRRYGEYDSGASGYESAESAAQSGNLEDRIAVFHFTGLCGADRDAADTAGGRSDDGDDQRHQPGILQSGHHQYGVRLHRRHAGLRHDRTSHRQRQVGRAGPSQHAGGGRRAHRGAGLWQRAAQHHSAGGAHWGNDHRVHRDLRLGFAPFPQGSVAAGDFDDTADGGHRCGDQQPGLRRSGRSGTVLCRWFCCKGLCEGFVKSQGVRDRSAYI